ncbi:unnamed protein product [Enterobius vermicularis]|uniref:PX domain-containing protein n=1 Tax=Enterobius vermicularis TaxID=51028 RepID=A0A0N4VMP2_ENTVE|nr:unnamed protein product [Enterobius vermicularis]
MALLDIDATTPHSLTGSIVSIPEYRISTCGKFAKYVIKVSIEPYSWTVERRYRDFAAFDEQRFKDRNKSFLPPKKFVRNMDPEFLCERRMELEKYIQAVMELELWLLKKRQQHALSKLLAYFLDFQEYVGFFTILVFKFLGSKV